MGQAIDALGINLPQLIAQVVNFSLLLVLLRLTLYKPILKMLDERKRKISDGLNAAEIARAEAAASQANIQGQLDVARKEGQEIVGNAQQIATRIQADAREQALKDAEAQRLRALADIQLERDRAIADLRAEFADITVSAAEKVINQSLDRPAHQRLRGRLRLHRAHDADDVESLGTHRTHSRVETLLVTPVDDHRCTFCGQSDGT